MVSVEKACALQLSPFISSVLLQTISYGRVNQRAEILTVIVKLLFHAKHEPNTSNCSQADKFLKKSRSFIMAFPQSVKHQVQSPRGQNSPPFPPPLPTLRYPQGPDGVNRDLKIRRRRRRQRERHKTIGLISKNNRSARALYVFVHFFAVLCKTTT